MNDLCGRDSIRAIWRKIKLRCTSPSCDVYPYYGGRGIRICDRWMDDFDSFLLDMGPRPSPLHTVERIDNDGHYEKSNCRWATRAEQMSNTRRNVYAVVNGEKVTLSEACRRLGLNLNGVRYRLRIGWTVDRALSEPFLNHIVLSAGDRAKIRKIRGLSQDKIAKKFGVSQSAISSILRGR